VESWRDDVVSEIETYIDDKSEKWLEGETGEKYQTWKAQFDDIPFEDVQEIEEIEEISSAEEIANYLEESITSSIDNV
jgi:hypothetical protein